MVIYFYKNELRFCLLDDPWTKVVWRSSFNSTTHMSLKYVLSCINCNHTLYFRRSNKILLITSKYFLCRCNNYWNVKIHSI